MNVKTEKEEKSLPEMQEKLTPWQQVVLARDAGRPGEWITSRIFSRIF